MAYVNNNTTLDSLFLYFAGRDIISISSIRALSEEDLMKSIIDNVHRYKISHGSDGRWSTYIPDPSMPNGRRRVQKNKKADLYVFLLSFYGLDEKTKSMGNQYKCYKLCKYLAIEILL